MRRQTSRRILRKERSLILQRVSSGRSSFNSSDNSSINLSINESLILNTSLEDSFSSFASRDSVGHSPEKASSKKKGDGPVNEVSSHMEKRLKQLEMLKKSSSSRSIGLNIVALDEGDEGVDTCHDSQISFDSEYDSETSETDDEDGDGKVIVEQKPAKPSGGDNDAQAS